MTRIVCARNLRKRVLQTQAPLCGNSARLLFIANQQTSLRPLKRKLSKLVQAFQLLEIRLMYTVTMELKNSTRQKGSFVGEPLTNAPLDVINDAICWYFKLKRGNPITAFDWKVVDHDDSGL